jgi:hypothetical protein
MVGLDPAISRGIHTATGAFTPGQSLELRRRAMDPFTLGFASRRPWRWDVRKVFNTEETGRTTEVTEFRAKRYELLYQPS